MKVSKNNEKGSVILLGMMVVTALGIMSAVFMTSIISERRLSERSNFTTVNAVNVAESGLEYALWEYKHGGTDFIGNGWQSTPTANDRTRVDVLTTSTGTVLGEYSVTVYDFATDPRIEATGFIPSQANPRVQATVQVTIERKPIFIEGIGGVAKVELKPQCLVDSYDSEAGAYNPSDTANDKVIIATNSTGNDSIKIGAQSTIYGDVYCGTSGDPDDAIDVGAQVTITGDIGTLSQSFDPPSVPAVSGLTTDLTITSNQTMSTGGSYDELIIKPQKILTINQDMTIYVNTLDIGSQAKIVIINDAKVTIIVNESLNSGPQSEINNLSTDPKLLSIYGTETCDTITLKPQSNFYGTIYAPDSNVDLSPQAELFGAVIGGTVTMSPQAKFHYDTSLTTSDDAPSFGSQVANWQTK